MAKAQSRRVAHTEHILFECRVSNMNASGLRLFRAPTVLDGTGTHKRLPHEVTWNDLREHDRIVALSVEDLDGERGIISILQFWEVLEVQNSEARVIVNNIVGSAADGEYVYDRLAGLLGLEPGVRDSDR